jgi:hypothetical protein
MSFGIFSSGDFVEVYLFFADLIGVSQRHTKKALATWFERNDMLTRGENNSPESDHAFLAYRLTNDRKRLYSYVAIRNEGNREKIGRSQPF